MPSIWSSLSLGVLFCRHKLERFQVLYISWLSSHHQAVSSDSDGRSATQMGPCSVNSIVVLSLLSFLELIQTLLVSLISFERAWIIEALFWGREFESIQTLLIHFILRVSLNRFKLSWERVWKGPSVSQLYSTAHLGSAGDGTYLQMTEGLFRQSSRCHCRRIAPNRFSGVKKAGRRKISQLSASSCSLWSKRSFLQQHSTTCISPGEDASVVHKVKSCRPCWSLKAPTTFFFDSKCYVNSTRRITPGQHVIK